MTYWNYEQLVRRGVIDPENDFVCYPAAFDQISVYADVHPHTYLAYGWRIAISTHGPHSVGVMPSGHGLWRTFSTWVPFEDPDHVTVDEMFEQLFFDVRTSMRNRRTTERDPNVWIYPPG